MANLSGDVNLSLSRKESLLRLCSYSQIEHDYRKKKLPDFFECEKTLHNSSGGKVNHTVFFGDLERFRFQCFQKPKNQRKSETSLMFC